MTKSPNSPRKVRPDQLRLCADNCGLLIVAAGFEDRARRVLQILKDSRISRVVLVRYVEGIRENDENFTEMRGLLSSSRGDRSIETVTFDLRRPDDYIEGLKDTLGRWRPDIHSDVWVDISAMAMHGICATLAAIRTALPGATVQVLYTEAAEYHPTKSEATKGDTSVAALTQEMLGNLIPKQFGGATGAVSTCLIVFAGYERHRSFGVVDELNPSRLVLVYGEPPGDEHKWRLQWSKRLHEQLHRTWHSASETVSTLDPLASVRLLNTYYGFMFADNNVAVSPICSKMQCIGCYLFWERYRDVQLVFPLPVTYLPGSFSRGHRQVFRFRLPTADELAAIIQPPL